MNGPEQERTQVLARLTEAAALLAGTVDARLVPPEGCSLGYAIRGARNGSDVAAVSGGLAANQGSIRPAGPAAFGADDRISRIILTAMKFDPDVRSAAAIRYSDAAFRILSDMFMDCVETDPANHPERISTMDWAVASCCSEGVPDAIAIRDDALEAPVICIFAEEPRIIASNIIILSNRIQ